VLLLLRSEIKEKIKMNKLERDLLNAVIKKAESLDSGEYLFSNNCGKQTIGWTVLSYSGFSSGSQEFVGFFYERVHSPEKIEMCIQQGDSKQILKYFKDKLGKNKIKTVDELHKVPIGEFYSQTHHFNPVNLEKERRKNKEKYEND